MYQGLETRFLQYFATKNQKYTNNINFGCVGMTSEDTAVPFPYTRLIVGTRHCRVLISGNINSDETGIDINRVSEVSGWG